MALPNILVLLIAGKVAPATIAPTYGAASLRPLSTASTRLILL